MSKLREILSPINVLTFLVAGAVSGISIYSLVKGVDNISTVTDSRLSFITQLLFFVLWLASAIKGMRNGDKLTRNISLFCLLVTIVAITIRLWSFIKI